MAYNREQREDVLAVLAANGGNVKRTARETGVDEHTIRDWRDGKAGEPGLGTGVPAQKAREALETRMEDVQALLLSTIPGKLQDAPLRDVATAYGILSDKLLLLRGQPTSHVQTTAGTDDERVSRLAELLGQAKERVGEAVERPAEDKQE